LLVIGFHNFID